MNARSAFGAEERSLSYGRIGTKLKFYHLRACLLAASFQVERHRPAYSPGRALSSRHWESSMRPSMPLAKKPFRLAAQLDEFSIHQHVGRIRVAFSCHRHVLAQAECVVLVKPRAATLHSVARVRNDVAGAALCPLQQRC